MSEIRQVLSCCAHNFRQWRRNPRIAVTFALCFILCFLLTDRSLSFAHRQNVPIMVLEPFIWTFGDATSVLLCSLLLVLLFGDMPFITAATPFFLVRTSRTTWLLGQVLYVAVATALYILFDLAATCLLSARSAFLGNQWSQASARLGYSGLGASSGVPASVTAMEMSHPVDCASNVFALLLLYMLSLGSLMLLLHIWKGRVWAVFGAAAYSMYGLLLEPALFQRILRLPEGLEYKANVLTVWCSPLNQATFDLHNFGYNALPRIWQSCLMLGALSGLFVLLAAVRMRRYQFFFSGAEA